jgi:hypothetical protein
MFLKINHTTWILSTLLLASTRGCDNKSAQIAREAADRQAQQNTEMAHLNKEIASGTHQLVEADAQARKEIVGVHHDLQTERTRLDTSWKDLEDERRQIAGERRTESMLVSVCELLGGVSLVLALLGFCWYALVAARRGEGADAQLNELLIQEILPDGKSPLLSVDQIPRPLLGSTPADQSSAK